MEKATQTEIRNLEAKREQLLEQIRKIDEKNLYKGYTKEDQNREKLSILREIEQIDKELKKLRMIMDIDIINRTK